MVRIFVKSVFEFNIKWIELANNSVVEMLAYTNQLKSILEIRKGEKMEVKSIFKKCIFEGREENDKDNDKERTTMHDRCGKYLEEWTTLLGDFLSFTWMQLLSAPSWYTVSESLEYMKKKKLCSS